MVARNLSLGKHLKAFYAIGVKLKSTSWFFFVWTQVSPWAKLKPLDLFTVSHFSTGDSFPSCALTPIIWDRRASVLWQSQTVYGIEMAFLFFRKRTTSVTLHFNSCSAVLTWRSRLEKSFNHTQAQKIKTFHEREWILQIFWGLFKLRGASTK